MKIRAHLGTIVLTLAVAAVVVPTALAGSPRDGRSPDTKDAAARAQLQAHNPGDGWYYRFVPLRGPSARVVLDGRSPDTKDAADYPMKQLMELNPEAKTNLLPLMSVMTNNSAPPK